MLFRSIQLLIIACGCVCSFASAGTFHVVPLKLFLDDETTKTSLKVANDSEQPLTLQVSAMNWSQDSRGEDIYGPTSNIIFFPKIMRVNAGEEGIIRIGRTTETPPRAEESYRIFVTELPVDSPGETAMKFAVRMTVPLFVRPAEAITNWSVADTKLSHEGLLVRVSNRSNHHIFIQTLKAIGHDDVEKQIFSLEKNGWYTLANSDKEFSLALEKESCDRASEINVVATANKDSHSRRMKVNRTSCAELPSGGDNPRIQQPPH